VQRELFAAYQGETGPDAAIAAVGEALQDAIGA